MSTTLAGRGTRLAAQIVDGFVGMLPPVVLAIAVPALTRGQDPAAEPGAVVGVLAGLYVLVILVVQLVLLHRHGQTIGKRIMKVKITKVADESNGGFVTNVLRAWWSPR